MKSIDWSDSSSARNLAIAELAEVCAAMGLSWSAVEKQFIIELPDVILTQVKPIVKTKKRFDISNWGPTGIDETRLKNIDDIVQTTDRPPYAPGEALPDDFQLPDTGEILEEGEPPKGDPNHED